MAVIIESLEIYHPTKKLDNNYSINIFGDDILNLLNHLGRSERFVVDNNKENTLTMGFEASKRCLEKAKISPNDLDIIVFVSDTPEYLIPTNALILRGLLGADNCSLVYDMNDSCIGMITAIDQVSSYMEHRGNYKNALIIGASYGSNSAQKGCPIVNTTVGDGAASVLLKKSSNNDSAGVVDALYHTDSKNRDFMLFPECGLSNITDSNIDIENKKFKWTTHDVSYFSDQWYKLILKILNKNNTDLKEIDHFFFSQFSHADIKDTLQKLGVDNWKDKYTFIADKYGYTGNTSPFFAMYEALKDNKIGKGDKVVFCSVGAGYTMGVMIYNI